MGFFKSLFGKDQQKDIQRGYADSQNMLAKGRTSALGEIGGGLTNARSVLQPFMQSGQRGQTAYENALGFNGQEARDQQFETGYQNDPALAYRNQNNANVMNALLRRYNAGPQGINSGGAVLGAGRLATEQFNNDWNGYLNRLGAMGQQGQQLAQFGAGLEYGAGKDRADIETGYGNTSAGNRINMANAMASSRNIGINNLLAIGGTAAKFMPTSRR